MSCLRPGETELMSMKNGLPRRCAFTDSAASPLDAAVTAEMTSSASRTASAADRAIRTLIASAAARSFVPWGFGNRRPWSTGRPRADRKQWPGQLHQTLFLVGMGYADDGSLPVIFAMASLVQ